MTEREWVSIWEDATALVANAPPASAGSAWFVRLESYDAVPVALAFNALITTSGVFMPAIESVITEIERIYAYGRGVPTGLETWEKIISDLGIFSYYKLQPSYPVEVDRRYAKWVAYRPLLTQRTNRLRHSQACANDTLKRTTQLSQKSERIKQSDVASRSCGTCWGKKRSDGLFSRKF